MVTKHGSAFGEIHETLKSIQDRQEEHSRVLLGVNRLQNPGAGGNWGHVVSRSLTDSQGVTGGFKNLGEFSHAVRIKHQQGGHSSDAVKWADASIERWGNEFSNRMRDGQWHSKVKANSPTGMNETFTGADGGYLVPPEFAAQILMRTYANDLLSRTTVMPIGGNSINVPAINETDRGDGSRFGGVRAYWRKEAGSVTATKPSVAEIQLALESLMLMVRTSNEVLEDTGGVLETLLTTIAAQELAFVTGDSLVNGDGVGKPLGIRKAPCLISVAKESGQGTGTLVAANILKMWSRLHPSARANAVWLYDQTIEPQLMQMTIGTAGANLVVWLPPGGLSGSPYSTLMGRPMLPIEFCQQLGTSGDIILADMSQILSATKGGVQTAVSMHLYFDTNEMAFRFTLRLDARPWWLKPLTPKNGGPTQGPMIVLDAR